MQLESSFSTNEPPLETQFPSDEERFYLPDEPEFYDLLSSQIEDKLRKSLPKWLKKDITINDKYSNVRIRTKIFLFVQSCPAIIKHTAGFTKEDAVRSFFYTLGELVKKRSEIISEIPTNTLTAITRASMAFALGREETEKNNTARIIDPKSLNPLTVVFAEQCFESPKSLGFQKEDAVAVIAHIGYCLGYFDEDEPRSQYFRAVFTEKLGDGAPPVVTETGEIGKVTSDRLQSLKDFWPQVYALAVTSVAIKNNKGTLLDPRDEMKARGRLHKDKRTAPIRSALLSIKNAMKGRDASTSDIENVDAAFTREEQKLSDQVKNQKRNVKRAFFDIVQSYNPDVTHYHVNEVPVINTEVLKPKSEKILSIFVQEAKGIHGDASRSTKLALVATTATKMIDFVERGDRSIDLENLFGKDFYTIDPIEQVALLLYAAIQHVQQGNRTKLAMQLLGTSFQKLLQSHTDEPMDIPENESNIVFSEPGWEITDRVLERSDEALERLYADSDPDDGFIVSADEDVLLKNRAENKEQLKELFTAIEDRGVMPFLMQLAGLTMGGCAAILLTLEALAGDAYSSGISPAILSVITVSSMILSFRVQGLIGRGASGVGDTLLDELLQTVNSSESIDVDSLEKKRRKKQNSMMRKLLLVFLTLMLIVPALDATSQVVDIVMTERGRSTNEMSDITNEVDMLALYNRPYQIGDVYHIPESIERENADYGMRFFQPTLIVGPDRERSVGWGFGEDVYFEVVDSIDENTHTVQPDELVYSFPSSSISRFNRVIHPFDGYEITKIYQLGGTEPIATREGGIYYDNNPSEVLLVTRRAEVITEFDAMEGTGYRYGSVWMQPGLRGRVYSPWEGWDTTIDGQLAYSKQAERLQLQLRKAGDDELADMYDELVGDIDRIVNRYYLSDRDASDQSDLSKDYTRAIMENIGYFSAYTNNERQYSLQYKPPAISFDSPFFELLGVASQPDAGYYCVVGNNIFQQYLTSVGVSANLVNGHMVALVEGQVMTRINHRNSRVELPDGRLLYTDMTPSDPNPGGDLSALETDYSAVASKIRLSRDIQEKIQAIYDFATDDQNSKRMIGAALFILASAGLSKAVRRREDIYNFADMRLKNTQKAIDDAKNKMRTESLAYHLPSEAEYVTDIATALSSLLGSVSSYLDDKQFTADMKRNHADDAEKLNQDVDEYILQLLADGAVSSLLPERDYINTRRRNNDHKIALQQFLRLEDALENIDEEVPTDQDMSFGQRGLISMISPETREKYADALDVVTNRIRSNYLERREMYLTEAFLLGNTIEEVNKELSEASARLDGTAGKVKRERDVVMKKARGLQAEWRGYETKIPGLLKVLERLKDKLKK